MSPTTPVPVVCAVVLNDAGNVLLAQRPPHKHLGLKWEFPGGKVEANETPPQALIREIKEELGCDIAVGHALPRFVFTYPSVTIEMLPFVCTLAPASPAPHPHEHLAVAWAPLETLADFDLAPADWPVVEHLRRTRSTGGT